MIVAGALLAVVVAAGLLHLFHTPAAADPVDRPRRRDDGGDDCWFDGGGSDGGSHGGSDCDGGGCD